MTDIFTGEGISDSSEQPSSMQEFTLWVQKYRPTTVANMILPPSIRSTVDTAIKLNAFGHYVLYSGKPGTGKTTLAMALPNTLGTTFKFFSAKTQSDVFDEIEDFSSSKMIDGKPRFVVIDEADHPRNPADFYRKLQTLIEQNESTIRFILTCNEFYRLPEPITSRCFPISFDYSSDDRVMKNAMYVRLLSIAETETSPYSGTVNKDTVKEIVQKCYPDMRLMTNTLFNNFLEHKCSIDGEVKIPNVDFTETLMNIVLTGDDIKVREYVRETYVDFDCFFHSFAEMFIMKLPPAGRLKFSVMTAYYEDMSNRQVNPLTVIDAYMAKTIDLLHVCGMLG